ncbi:MAG: RNA-directed DNA polymerase [Verrucomicrobia bacterium]|nr:RNA-directed DNA polymerase [Verrucomicrobiota bacterium]
MGLVDLFKNLFRGPDKGFGVDELSRRLGMKSEELRAVAVVYRDFTITKRAGGVRRITAPDPKLKSLQRRILRRLLARLECHPSVTGFEAGHSIVTNALCHTGKAVVVRMDLKDFFEKTAAGRLGKYFRKIGWNREASGLLMQWCAHQGGLPQGAPTSPRLSNLLNYGLDIRLSKLAEKFGAVYTRYADDLTFSFDDDQPGAIRQLIHLADKIVREQGYTLHQHKKLHIRRRHDRQVVTGLVVNQKVNLPRRTRRWLRAIEHRAAMGGGATLTPEQRQGWKTLQAMIAEQSGAANRPH